MQVGRARVACRAVYQVRVRTRNTCASWTATDWSSEDDGEFITNEKNFFNGLTKFHNNPNFLWPKIKNFLFINGK